MPQASNVVRVHAQETVLDDGRKIDVMGLEELIDLTMRLVPDSVKDAVAAAQRVSLKAKQQRAHLAVLAAIGVGIPIEMIPIANIPGSVAVQISMIISISAIWGLPLSKTFLTTLLFTAATSATGTLGVPGIISMALRLIPGIGSIVSPVVGSAITTAIGEAYIATLSVLTRRNPSRNPTEKEIINEFPLQLKRQIQRQRDSSGPETAYE